MACADLRERAVVARVIVCFGSIGCVVGTITRVVGSRIVIVVAAAIVA